MNVTEKYRLRYAGRFVDTVGILIFSLSIIFIPFAVIVLINNIEIHKA